MRGKWREWFGWRRSAGWELTLASGEAEINCSPTSFEMSSGCSGVVPGLVR